MASKDEYYALLSRAVAGLDRDAYAARGAVYDREHKAMLRRLFASDSYLSDAEIDEEQWAFREAVRRLEFGDEPDAVPLVPHRATAQETLVETAPPAFPLDLDRERPTQPEPPPRRGARRVNWSQRDAWQEPAPVEQPPLPPQTADFAVDDTPATAIVPKRRRSVFSRALGRVLFAVVLIAIGIVGYGVATGQLTMPWLTRFAGSFSLSSAATSDRVILYDGELSDEIENENVGRVTWRSTLESAGSDGAQVAVLHVNASIPQRKMILSVSMRPEAGGGAMSHLFELRFLRSDRQPDDSIANITGIVTRAGGVNGARAMLAGSVVRVSPGVFLFGLAGHQGAREVSLQQLKDMSWLDIPLTYRNGAKGVLAIEKAGKGEQVINDVLSKWEG